MVPFGLDRNGDGTVEDMFWFPDIGPDLRKETTDGNVATGKKQDAATFGLAADGGNSF